MPILFVLTVVAACLPLPWPAPLVDVSFRGSFALTVAAALVPVLLAAALSRWVVRSLARHPDRRAAVLSRYAKLRRVIGVLNLVAVAVSVGVFGWGWTAWHWPVLDLGRPVLAPGAELLVPAPYFLALFALWAVYFPAERALHRTSAAVRSSLEPEAYWSAGGYVLFHLRQFVLLVGLPVGLVAAQQSLARVAAETVESTWFQVGSLASAVVLFVLLPRLVKPLLGLAPLPKGPARDRLEASARRLNFRYTDLLLWPTRGAVANAMVVGVVPWARYVVFTDRLLDGLAPDELDAVFGHEAGHVRHRHIPYYAAFFLTSTLVGTAALGLFDQALRSSAVTVPDGWGGWMSLPPIVLMGLYVFVVFGLLSRRCERQADVFGCRAGSCRDPQCGGHDADTELAPGGRGLCRTGVWALVRALDRVAELNGMDALTGRPTRGGAARRAWAWVKAWQHGPVPARIAFLERLAADPALGDRSDRRAFYFRAALAALLLLALAALGTAVGWAELWRML
jgi:STE24 endopeptidase